MLTRFTMTGTLALAITIWNAGLLFSEDRNEKIRVVIIDGQNNHDWRSTTPVMRKALEDCGRFTVEVATSPQVPSLPKPSKPQDEADVAAMAKYRSDQANYEAELPKFNAQRKDALAALENWEIDFQKYDVVVNNYNGKAWSQQINTEIERRLKSGKIGLVIVHAANNAFGEWTEYNQMIGMGWREKSAGERLKVDDFGKQIRVPKGEGLDSGHRTVGNFSIIVRDKSHPITHGMPIEWMHAQDELYDNMRGPIENVQLLATAYSKGTMTHEPMMWTVGYGKGRVFHTPMGHSAASMMCVGFQSTLQRGTEWAATGKVTIPIPGNFPTEDKASTLSLEKK